MKIITYSLYDGEENSNSYYRNIEKFSEIVVYKGLQMTMPWIKKLKAYIEQQQLETVRTNEEYMLEILTLGVLWVRYSDDAAGINQIPNKLLTKLVKRRQKGGKLKRGVDYIRGILGTLFLYSKHRSDLVDSIPFTMDNLTNLIDWLSAAGEFIQETKRFRNWMSYLRTVSDEEVAELIALAVFFAVWFEEQSLDRIGKYTEEVETYLDTGRKRHLWREDLIFCSRQRVEYHLNMVGAQIMNHAYRSDFIKTRKKAVFLPACIRKNLNGTCKARSDKDILHCVRCNLNCQVNKIKELSNRYGYDVLIIPHESSAFSKNTIKEGELGIIGVACILNLLAGGWKAKGLGIPPQCVLLDYCGCKNHWDEEGFSTSINMEQLHKLMQ